MCSSYSFVNIQIRNKVNLFTPMNFNFLLKNGNKSKFSDFNRD